MRKPANDRRGNNFARLPPRPAACTQNRHVFQRILLPMLQLDDTALQLYKGGDYGAYLDLEASINEQQEEFEGFHEGER